MRLYGLRCAQTPLLLVGYNRVRLFNNCCALQFFHSDPVLKLRVRSEPVGSLGNDSSEDLCVIYPKAIARIDASDLKVGPISPLSSHTVMVAVSFANAWPPLPIIPYFLTDVHCQLL